MQRRTLVSVLIAAVLIVALAVFAAQYVMRGSASGLTVISFGGAYQEAQREGYMRPFAAETGIAINEGEYNGDYGMLRERATASSPSWDVVSVESAPALRGEREGIFLPIPPSVFEGLHLNASARRAAAAGHLQFSTILGYRSDERGPQPQTWSDFWDVARFPGRRGLRNNPRGTLEIALLADGVAPDQLYPLDVDRALRKLDQIRDQIVFWESGAQPIQLLANRTVRMTSVYNGRIWSAKMRDRLPLAWSMNGGLLETEYWAVLRNSANPQRAFEFIRYSLEVPRQADFSNRIAYIPTNVDAQPLISATVRTGVPDTSAAGGQINVNADWWAQNEARVAASWQQWTARR
jgi:putative spermidine/putrescine transport system substrate-binding protein